MNRASLLDFENVIGQNGINSDSKKSHFVGVVKLKRIYPRFIDASFTNGLLLFPAHS